LENVYDHIDDIRGKKLKENLTNHKEEAFMSKQLVTIERDAPLEISTETTVYKGYATNDVRAIFTDIGFKSLVSRLTDADDTAKNKMPHIEYTVINELDADIFTGTDALVFEMLADNYHYAEIERIASVNEQYACFLQTEVAVTAPVFKRWAEDAGQKKIVFDAKKTQVALLNHGIRIQGMVFDMLMA